MPQGWEDLDLPYKGTEANQWDDAVNWIDSGVQVQGGRDFDFLTRYGLISSPHQIFGGENKATYAFRFSLDAPGGTIGGSVGQVKKIIMGILGYGMIQAGVPGIHRVVPIKDPDKLGMVADRIVSSTYVAPSGYVPQLAELYGQDPFADDFFLKRPPERTFGDTDPGIPNQKGVALYNYLVVVVEFCHLPYPVLSDAQVEGDETKRYMFLQESPSTEYVQVPRGQVFWFEGPNVNELVGEGGNLLRMIQTVTLTWNRVPYDAMVTLIPKWKSLLGTVNDQTLTLPMFFDRSISYEAQTMLFMPYRIKPRLSPHGFLEYDVELNWGWRGGSFGGTNVTWNKFLNPNGAYYKVGWVNGILPVPIYTVTDHTIFSQP